MPRYQHLEPLSKQVTIVIGLTVVGFMAFGLALSFYRNILFEQTLEDMKENNIALKNNIQQRHRDLEYYRSAQYKDKYAKENLGLINPSEKVLVITKKPTDIILTLEADATPNEQQEAAYLELLHQMPILEHWKLYFFHKDKIEELKRGI